MIIKIGDKFYDPDDQIVMVILSDRDKKLINRMPEENHNYCVFPDSMPDELVDEFMNDIPEEYRLG